MQTNCRDNATVGHVVRGALALTLMAGTAGIAGAGESDGLPESLTLSGIVRDFQERSVDGGHPDFEQKPSSGFGHYMGNVANELDDEGKPRFTGAGYKVAAQWEDADGNPIHPRFYDPDYGDQTGWKSVNDPGGITSADSFSQWFRTVPGVNIAQTQDITLRLDSESGKYIFDDRFDSNFANNGGFFPIDEKMFGNSKNSSHNFHFTFELDTEFTYEANSGQVFTFRGDDDVFVFIDGQVVIDIGGVHGATTQTVDLDRLDWLQDGKSYSLRFFFAERHRTQSNFRIETTLKLRSAQLPNTTHMYD